jgi:ADP-ribose pyrophosphatase YjhB (NUDIX family)
MPYFVYALRTLLGLLLRRPILGTCVIPITDDGSIVLVLRRDNRRWSLPGGIVDWGEDIMTAATRELKEETGLEVDELVRLVGLYSSPERDPRFHSVCVGIAIHVTGTPYAADPREILDVRPFAVEQLPWDNLSHDHVRHLKDFLNGDTVLA